MTPTLNRATESIYRRTMASDRIRQRPVLTREVIADQALAFIDEHGMEALTLTALGRVMNCHGTAIYRHFRDKDELIEAALGRMYEVSGVGIPPKGTPRQRLMGLMRSLRRAFAQHPNFALRNLTLHEERETAELVAGALALLEEMGLKGRNLVVGYQMLETYSIGTSAYDFAATPEAWGVRRASRRRVGHPDLDRVYREVDAVAKIDEAAFEVGLAALLDACEGLAASPARR
jgi:AcrR family transcriptional regulator